MYIRISVALFCAILLSGCVFQDRSQDYRAAGSIPPIQVPENLRPLPMEPRYPIPEVAQREDVFHNLQEEGFSVPRPEPKNVEAEQARVKIQRVGERRWILVEAPTGQVWPLTQSFLSREGVDVVRTQPATGLIETDWLQFSDDPDTKSQFRLRIEKGVRSEATEVHIEHRELPVATAPGAQWSEDQANPERVIWLMDELAQSLAAFIDNRSASLLGQAVGGEPKAELSLLNGEPVLRLRLDDARAWATVAHAVDQGNFARWSENGAQRIFYVQYFGFDKERNRFTRLFLGRGAQAVKEAPYSLTEVLNHLEEAPEVTALFGSHDGIGYGDGLAGGAGYLVQLHSSNGQVLVRVRDHRGRRLDSAANRRIVSEIHRQLI